VGRSGAGRGWGGADRGRAQPSRTGAAPIEPGRGGPGPGVARAAVRGGLAAAAARVEVMREREAGERNGGHGYCTRLCSSG
jgi:hypothetical protein